MLKMEPIIVEGADPKELREFKLVADEGAVNDLLEALNEMGAGEGDSVYDFIAANRESFDGEGVVVPKEIVGDLCDVFEGNDDWYPEAEKVYEENNRVQNAFSDGASN
jgi:hypothetical protein